MGYPTIADFFLTQYSYYVEKLYPEEFPQYKNIKNVRENIANLPEVKKYYERKDAIITPFLPPNRTAFPFFWPGTDIAVPAAPQKSFVKKVSQTPKAEKHEHKEETKIQPKVP